MARRRRPTREPTRLPSDREQALFEAGIKLGGVFHQFIGVPVSASTASHLARTIEKAVALQPYVRKVRVRIDTSRAGRTRGGHFGYHYLSAPMIDARVEVEVGTARVAARLSFREDLRYPLMRVLSPSPHR